MKNDKAYPLEPGMVAAATMLVPGGLAQQVRSVE